MIPIVPALIPKSAAHVREVLPRLRFSPEVHLDMVDGRFVSFVSWPYEPQGTPDQVRDVTDSFTLEVDLMVAEPLPAACLWEEAGADMLVFHVETISFDDWRDYARRSRVSLSISALNDTPVEKLLEYMEWAHAVQLMGIKEIGTQGQPFDKRVLERIALVKRHRPRMPVTVDGSVNLQTINDLTAAGADRLIAGSAIVSAANPAVASFELSRLITHN